MLLCELFYMFENTQFYTIKASDRFVNEFNNFYRKYHLLSFILYNFAVKSILFLRFGNRQEELNRNNNEVALKNHIASSIDEMIGNGSDAHFVVSAVNGADSHNFIWTLGYLVFDDEDEQENNMNAKKQQIYNAFGGETAFYDYVRKRLKSTHYASMVK